MMFRLLNSNVNLIECPTTFSEKLSVSIGFP
jgi:hypothetical protein